MEIDLRVARSGWVAGLLDRAVDFHPERPALASPGVELTYRELSARVGALSEAIWRCGMPAGDRPEAIIVVTEHDHRTPELFWGVWNAGHALVPVSGRLPDESIARIAALTGARLGILAPSQKSRLPSLEATADATAWADADSVDELLGSQLPESDAPIPPETAMIIFTSGTTGSPKGVLLTHRNLVVAALSNLLAFDAAPGSRHVNALPLAHLTGASRIIMATAGAGLHITLPEFDPSLVLNAIQRWRATHLTLAPAMVPDLLAAVSSGPDLTSLQRLVYGTAPMAVETVNDLQTQLDCGLIHGYGLTESCGVATTLDAAAHASAVSSGAGPQLQSVGRPIPGIELKIVDSTGGTIQRGATGEVCLSGLKVSPGYLGEETHRGDAWLRTGDLGRISSHGNLVLAGRVDDMIITGGVNVQPLEVELAVKEFPGVADCAAFPVPHERWGQAVHVAIVADRGAEVSSAELRSQLSKQLDRYKIPKSVHIVDDLPRSPIGKVLRSELTQRFRADG